VSFDFLWRCCRVGTDNFPAPILSRARFISGFAMVLNIIIPIPQILHLESLDHDAAHEQCRT